MVDPEKLLYEFAPYSSDWKRRTLDDPQNILIARQALAALSPPNHNNNKNTVLRPI
jgi:hypothetical protein